MTGRLAATALALKLLKSGLGSAFSLSVSCCTFFTFFFLGLDLKGDWVAALILGEQRRYFLFLTMDMLGVDAFITFFKAGESFLKLLNRPLFLSLVLGVEGVSATSSKSTPGLELGRSQNC